MWITRHDIQQADRETYRQINRRDDSYRQAGKEKSRQTLVKQGRKGLHVSSELLSSSCMLVSMMIITYADSLGKGVVVTMNYDITSLLKGLDFRIRI